MSFLLVRCRSQLSHNFKTVRYLLENANKDSSQRLLFTNRAIFNAKQPLSLTQSRLQSTESKPAAGETAQPKTAPNTNATAAPKQPPKKKSSKLLLVFLGGIATYFGITYYMELKGEKGADTSAKALEYKPENITKFSKRIDCGAKNPGDIQIILYQYSTCPFCCKVRAYLDYFGYKYDIVEVNSIWRSQTKWSSYKKVPVLAVKQPQSDEFTQLNDSSVIISALETFRMHPELTIKQILEFYEPIKGTDTNNKATLEFPNKYFVMLHNQTNPTSINELRDERDWRAWVDENFVHVISPNVYRTLAESYETFAWFDKAGEWDKNFSNFERLTIQYLGAIVMYFIGKKLLKKYNLKENVRESLTDLGKEWSDAVGSLKFRGGEEPNLADLAFYGALNSFRGCEAFFDLMQNQKLKEWFDRLDQLVQAHQGISKLNAPAKQISPQSKTRPDEAKRKRFFFF